MLSLPDHWLFSKAAGFKEEHVPMHNEGVQQALLHDGDQLQAQLLQQLLASCCVRGPQHRPQRGWTSKLRSSFVSGLLPTSMILKHDTEGSKQES